jgi:pimeloyl-ACP methyl ester carboxylesterase
MTSTEWLDRSEYPFPGKFMDVDGGRMHYVDVGEGPPIVLVHGTPTWSFLYRKLIRDLSKRHRVVAPDHIGFGLSDKPATWGYHPADHARNLATLLDRLDLEPFTLVVHDFGGPIGLSYAIERPERVHELVLFNTFLWSLRDNPTAVRASNLFGGPIGRFLYTRLNLSPRFLIPAAFGDKSRLSKAVHEQYLAPFPNASSRMGPWTLAKELIGSSDWFDSLWRRRDRIASKPVLLLWGMRDPAFGREALAKAMTAFPGAAVRRFESAGHFVQEEVEGIGAMIEEFLEKAKASV